MPCVPGWAPVTSEAALTRVTVGKTAWLFVKSTPSARRRAPLVERVEVLLASPHPIGRALGVARRARLERDGDAIVFQRLVGGARRLAHETQPEARVGVPCVGGHQRSPLGQRLIPEPPLG